MIPPAYSIFSNQYIYQGKGWLADIGRTNLAAASNNLKQIRRGAANMLGNWAQALQGDDGGSVDM